MSSSMFNLKDKIVLISGASSGIGEATAKLFAQHGARLSLASIEHEALEGVASKCRAAGSPEVITWTCNLTEDVACKQVVEETVNHFKGLDVFVNSAGILTAGVIQDVSLEDFDKCMAINTRSPFVMAQLCLPHLIKSKGNMVFVSSVVSIKPSRCVVYDMSKCAVDGLVRNLAMAAGEKGVRVNSVNPGTVRTSLFKNAGLSDKESDEIFTSLGDHHVRGSIGNPEEIGATIVFLASDCSCFTTGQNVVVDGGYSIMMAKSAEKVVFVPAADDEKK